MIGLSPNDADQAIEVLAATCSLKTLLFTNYAGAARAEKPFTGKVLRQLAFTRGKMHYLGDIKGSVRTEVRYPTTTTY